MGNPGAIVREERTKLLLAGPQEIAIYGDGSYSSDLLDGAWAAHVPSFGLQIAGVGSGPSAAHFEFCALMEGIRAVVRIDHTNRPLHLHTDSDYAISALRFLSSKTDLPPLRSFDSIRDEYVRAIQLVGTRPVHWSRSDTKRAFHRTCHKAAKCALRKRVHDHFARDAVMALRHEQRRLEDLLRSGERLMRQMRRLENKLGSCDDRITHYVARLGLPIPFPTRSSFDGDSSWCDDACREE